MFVISPESYEWLLRELAKPAEPNPRLVALFAEHDDEDD